MPKPVLWPLVAGGFLYARARYGVDLYEASPEAAIRATKTPVLLIDGTRDTNVPFHHSKQLLASSDSAVTKLWAVEGAEHVGAFSANPQA